MLVVVIPLMVLVIGILMKVCTKLFETMQTKIDNLNNTLQENLVAIRVVKAFVREGYERIKFKKSNDELMDAALAVGLRIIAIMPVMMLALNGATVAVLYFGGGMVMGGTFELGDLQAFINYIVQILMSVMMVAMSLLQLSRAQACAHRIKEVLETEPSVENKPEGLVENCREFCETMDSELLDRIVESYHKWTGYDYPKDNNICSSQYGMDFEKWWLYPRPLIGEW